MSGEQIAVSMLVAGISVWLAWIWYKVGYSKGYDDGYRSRWDK